MKLGVHSDGLLTIIKVMKTQLTLLVVALTFCGFAQAQQPSTGATTPSKLGAPANLKRFNVTIRRFDVHKGIESGEDFVLPVDSIDEDHAIASTLANAISWTVKAQGGAVLPVAFCCVAIEERK